jgi:hypothetical protein
MFTRLDKLMKFGFLPFMMTFIEGDGGGDAGGGDPAAECAGGVESPGLLDRDERVERRWRCSKATAKDDEEGDR